MKRVPYATLSLLFVPLLLGCATTGDASDPPPHGGASQGDVRPEEIAAPSAGTDYLLQMEPAAGGYRLGSEFRLEAPGNEGFEYRGRQARHVVYHRKVVTGGDRERYTDILLHVGPAGRVNRIVLLRQFASTDRATDFYEREYRRQREGYYLTEDSGNSGTLRYAKVEAFPDQGSWEGAYRRHLEQGEGEPFRFYYHPLIAARTASFAVVRGVPTVALIYEGHGYRGGRE